jgi:hypothetical protein
VVHFNGEKRRTVEVATASARAAESTPETGRQDRSETVSIAPRPERHTVFRRPRLAFLGQRLRAVRKGGPQRRYVSAGTATLGSFEDLERELSRSRRFGRPFVLARVQRSRASNAAEGWREQTLALLTSLIRSVDRVWSSGDDVYLLLPESDRAAGAAALARMRGPVSRVLTDEEVDGIIFAVFAPDECPTRQALLSALHQRVRGATAKTSDRESAVVTADDREEASG